MRHEHLVVTVEAGLKDRIDDDLDEGESLEAWVADAVERKLAAKDGSPAGGHRERLGGRGDDGRGRDRRGSDDGRDERADVQADRERDPRRHLASGRSSDESEGDDEYDEGFEYVDDCSI